MIAFSKLDVAPTYRRVYDAIEREILSRRLQAGDPLPAETTLARQFGVNRSTIREGIRLLEQSGLVEREGGRRLKVTLPHYRDLASRASRALILHQITFRELWETSMALEVMSANYAAERCTKDDIAKIRENIAKMKSAIKSDADFIRLDIEFHNLVAAAAGNRALTLSREPVSLLFFPAGRAILPRLKTHQRVVDAHEEILDALESHDKAQAEAWMQRHMSDFKRAYERTGLDMDSPIDSADLAL